LKAEYSGLSFRSEGGGIYLPELEFWLDPSRRQAGPEKVFISHGHADHLGYHREVILTRPTAWFMHTRIGGKRLEHVLEYRQPQEFILGRTSCRLTLLPAGHVLGSAMLLLEAKGKSVLYTGDFKPLSALAAEACEPVPADVLIMETTFGRPGYRFPTGEQLLPAIREFCEQALQQGLTPVLLGYSLGKGQEIILLLKDTGLKLMLQEQVHKITRIYERFGVVFPSYEKYDSAQTQGRTIIWPPQVSRDELERSTAGLRTAIFTGWAIDSGCRYRCRTDAAFPLSDHADFEQLLEFVRRVRPKKVLTVHGFAADFAQTLREQGYDAQALSEPEQLSLPFWKLESES
jgi:Cft2 family RNA processing exonuclease